MSEEEGTWVVEFAVVALLKSWRRPMK